MKRNALLLALFALTACGGASDEAPAATAANQAPMSAPAETPAAKPVIHVWKDPTCGCCTGWVDHLRAAGYTVEVEDVSVSALQAVKNEHHIPGKLTSCHTATVGNYVIEGHVPAETIDRLLAEHPDVDGLAVPGMPVGSPGMEMPGQPAQPYDVVAFSADGKESVFEKR